MDRRIEEQLAEDRAWEAAHGVTPGRTRQDPREQLERAGIRRRAAAGEGGERAGGAAGASEPGTVAQKMGDDQIPPTPVEDEASPQDPARGGAGADEDDRPELPPLAVVVSRYNDAVTGNMLRGALEEFQARGGWPDRIAVIDAFGAYELTPLAEAAARCGLYAGVLCLGCIIKGETDHDTYIAHAVAQGLANITVKHSVPCAFGVLTVNTLEQALARAGGRDGVEPGNKGAESMAALVETIRAKMRIEQAAQEGLPGFSHRIPTAADAPPEVAKGPVRTRLTAPSS